MFFNSSEKFHKSKIRQCCVEPTICFIFRKMKYDFQICSLIWRLEQCFYHWFCRKCAEQKLHPLSYTDGDMDSQRQQDQHKSRYVPHIICDSGFLAKMSVLFACLIKRVSKLPLYQLVIILSSADVLCKQFGRPPVKYFTDRPKAVLLLWIFYVFSVFRLLCLCARLFMCALFVFVALRPKSTAMVIAGRSVHLTTLFPGQAWTRG